MKKKTIKIEYLPKIKSHKDFDIICFLGNDNNEILIYEDYVKETYPEAYKKFKKDGESSNGVGHASIVADNDGKGGEKKYIVIARIFEKIDGRNILHSTAPNVVFSYSIMKHMWNYDLSKLTIAGCETEELGEENWIRLLQVIQSVFLNTGDTYSDSIDCTVVVEYDKSRFITDYDFMERVAAITPSMELFSTKNISSVTEGVELEYGPEIDYSELYKRPIFSDANKIRGIINFK